MVSSPWDTGVFGLHPISSKLGIKIRNTFCGFHKCKTNADVLHFHLFYQLPPNRFLIPAYVYAMYAVFRGHVYGKCRVVNKGRPVIKPIE